jgi:hypothetical protein
MAFDDETEPGYQPELDDHGSAAYFLRGWAVLFAMAALYYSPALPAVGGD